jgi:hypothetical protein
VRSAIALLGAAAVVGLVVGALRGRPVALATTCPAELDGDVVSLGIDPPTCRREVRYDRTAAILTDADGRLFRVGEPGDWLVVGDWDCDGSITPALYRPTTGDVLVFDRWAGDPDGTGEVVSARPVDTGVIDGVPRVARSDGCDRVAVYRKADGSPD